MITFGTEQAQKQLRQDRLAKNRDAAQEAIELAFMLELFEKQTVDGETKRDGEVNKGAFLAECVVEELCDQEYPAVMAFFQTVFEWVEREHINLIPAKYVNAVELVNKLKLVLGLYGSDSTTLTLTEYEIDLVTE